MERQARIIDDFLDAARAFQGSLTIDLRPVALEQVIDRAIEMAQPAANAKGIEFKVRHESRPRVIEVDAQRLQRALANMLLHALTFTGQDEPLLIWTYIGSEFVEIGVRNAGGGVEPDLLPAPLQGADAEQDMRTVESLGLGMTLAKQLVELQGGHIEMRAAGHRAASLVVRFPATVLASVPATADARPGPRLPSNERLDGVHILLVEDDPDALEFLTLILRGAGARVSAFTLAEPAFVFFVSSPLDSRPDIVVSDIAMPFEDGYSFVSRMRAWEKLNASLPVPAIAVTAFSRDEDSRRALASGFDRHIAKPVDASRLVQSIAQWA